MYNYLHIITSRCSFQGIFNLESLGNWVNCFWLILLVSGFHWNKGMSSILMSSLCILFNNSLPELNAHARFSDWNCSGINLRVKFFFRNKANLKFWMKRQTQSPNIKIIGLKNIETTGGLSRIWPYTWPAVAYANHYTALSLYRCTLVAFLTVYGFETTSLRGHQPRKLLVVIYYSNTADSTCSPETSLMA